MFVTLDPDAPRLHATSRLDAEVSGLVTFARTPAAAEALRQARAEGRYGRRYIALTLTPPRKDEGAWDSAISIDPRDRRKRVAGQGAQAALATDFKPLTDMRASAEYRAQVAQNLLERLWLETRPASALPATQTTVWSTMTHTVGA